MRKKQVKVYPEKMENQSYSDGIGALLAAASKVESKTSAVSPRDQVPSDYSPRIRASSTDDATDLREMMRAVSLLLATFVGMMSSFSTRHQNVEGYVHVPSRSSEDVSQQSAETGSEQQFTFAAPLLFGKDFVKLAKEHIDSVGSMRKLTNSLSTGSQFFWQGRPHTHSHTARWGGSFRGGSCPYNGKENRQPRPHDGNRASQN